MKNKIYIFAFFVLNSIITIGQTPNWLWAKNPVGPYAEITAIAVDPNGNSYITGNFSALINFDTIAISSGGNTDAFTAKYNNTGNGLWADGAGGTHAEIGYSVAADTNGNSFVTGSFKSHHITFGSTTLTNNSPGQSQVYFVKYDATANALWAKCATGTASYASDFSCVAADRNGNSYFTGLFTGPSITFDSITITKINGGFGDDMFIVKYDSSGNVLWGKSACLGAPHCEGITTDAAGNFYITGYYYGYGITFDSITLVNPYPDEAFIVKYDSSGNAIWARSPHGFGVAEDRANRVTTDANGNCYVAGIFESDSISFGTISLVNANPSVTNADFFIVKYDASGNAIWAHSGGGGINTFMCVGGVAVDANGNSYIAGNFATGTITIGSDTVTNSGTGFDFFIAKYDSSGNLSWVIGGGGTDSDGCGGIGMDGYGNIYAAGAFRSPVLNFGNLTLTNTGSANAFLAKIGNTTGINTETFPLDIATVFPNPVKDKLNVQMKENDQSEIILYDITSRKLLQQSFTNSTTLNTAQLAKGIYLYKVRNKNGVIKKGKVVKE